MYGSIACGLSNAAAIAARPTTEMGSPRESEKANRLALSWVSAFDLFKANVMELGFTTTQ